MKRSRAFYAATIFAMIALTAGFVLGAISLTNSTQNAQGNSVTPNSPITGLTYTSTVLSVTPGSGFTAYSGTAATPQAVVTGANTICADTCTAGDFSEVVTYTFTNTMTGSVQITISATWTGGAGAGTSTLYLKQAGAAVGGTIVLYWDFASTTTAINTVTLSAQACTGAGGSCP